MTNSTKLIIKFVTVCAIYIPIKYTWMQGRPASFLEDFMVAFFAFAIGHAIIYFLERRNSDSE